MLLLLGGASLLSAVAGRWWLSAAGVTVGAATVHWFGSNASTAGTRCGTHAGLALGAVCTHRVVEGVVLGTLYTAGAAVGVVGAVVLAVHVVLETAADADVSARAGHPVGVAGAIVLLQVGHVVGGLVGLDVGDAVPLPVRTFGLAIAGGVLLVVGAGEVERSVAARRPEPGG